VFPAAGQSARRESAAAGSDELNAAVEAGEFEDVAAAAIAASAAAASGAAATDADAMSSSRKRARTTAPAGNAVLESLRWLHEALQRDGKCQLPTEYTRDGTVVELVSLNQLYRIFERC